MLMHGWASSVPPKHVTQFTHNRIKRQPTRGLPLVGPTMPAGHAGAMQRSKRVKIFVLIDKYMEATDNPIISGVIADKAVAMGRTKGEIDGGVHKGKGRGNG